MLKGQHLLKNPPNWRPISMSNYTTKEREYMKDRVREIAVNLFKATLVESAEYQGTFRLLITAKIGDENKPLLILGNAHSAVEDGHCIAILNPSEELLNKVVAGCSYGATLKEIVQGECDLMLDIWIDAYKEGVSILSTYQAKTLSPSKFKIK